MLNTKRILAAAAMLAALTVGTVAEAKQVQYPPLPVGSGRCVDGYNYCMSTGVRSEAFCRNLLAQANRRGVWPVSASTGRGPFACTK